MLFHVFSGTGIAESLIVDPPRFFILHCSFNEEWRMKKGRMKNEEIGSRKAHGQRGANGRHSGPSPHLTLFSIGFIRVPPSEASSPLTNSSFNEEWRIPFFILHSSFFIKWRMKNEEWRIWWDPKWEILQFRSLKKREKALVKQGFAHAEFHYRKTL